MKQPVIVEIYGTDKTLKTRSTFVRTIMKKSDGTTWIKLNNKEVKVENIGLVYRTKIYE